MFHDLFFTYFSWFFSGMVKGITQGYVIVLFYLLVCPYPHAEALTMIPVSHRQSRSLPPQSVILLSKQLSRMFKNTWTVSKYRKWRSHYGRWLIWIPLYIWRLHFSYLCINTFTTSTVFLFLAYFGITFSKCVIL